MAASPSQQHHEDYDPLADFESMPALSFAQAQPGTVYKGTLTALPVERQDRDIQTKEPKYWKDGQPQLCVVLRMEVETQEGPQERSVWAKKPSSLYRALGQAQKDSGQRFALGGTLLIRLERLEPSKTPGFSPQKIYAAKYEPPVVRDPWDSQTPATKRTDPATFTARAQAQAAPAGYPSHQTAPAAPSAPAATPAPTPTGFKW